MRIEISLDDAHKQDLRALEMCEAYGLKAMLYVPSTNRGHKGQAGLTDKEILAVSQKHDIGFHSWNHPYDLKECADEAEVFLQVTRGRDRLEALIGRPITSFCYPRGRYDKRAEKAVKVSGYTEARTVDVGHVSMDYDPFRKPTTVHIHPRRKEYGELHWVEYTRQKLQEAAALGDSGYFHLWGHGWEINKFDLWSELEEALQVIADIKQT